MSFAELFLANVIVCIAGFVQASVGIGFAMIAVPLLVLIDLGYAPGPVIFVILILAIAMVTVSWRNIDLAGLTILLPGIAVGTVLGTLILGLLSPAAFGILFGFVVLVAILSGLLGVSPSQSRSLYGVGGLITGLMGTVTGIHGPPLAVVYQTAEHATARATIALVFVIACVFSLVSLAIAGHFSQDGLMRGLSLLPGLVIGFGLSVVGARHIPATQLRNIMLLTAFVSSFILIGKSILSVT